jgi:hypothetical protein
MLADFPVADTEDLGAVQDNYSRVRRSGQGKALRYIPSRPRVRRAHLHSITEVWRDLSQLGES